MRVTTPCRKFLHDAEGGLQEGFIPFIINASRPALEQFSDEMAEPDAAGLAREEAAGALYRVVAGKTFTVACGRSGALAVSTEIRGAEQLRVEPIVKP